MKKIFLLIASFFIASLTSMAQDATTRDYSDIWKRNKYFKFVYPIAQSKATGSALEKGKYGVAIGYGHTFLFPKQPLWGLVKFGFDANWMDFQYVKYHNYDSAGGNLIEGGENFLDKLGNLGRMSMQIGILGIGPNATVAPFSMMDNQARFLKASIYFHYQPTVGAYMMSQDGDFESSFAYCNMFRFGGNIRWKMIGIGIEGFWGSGKFKPLDLNGFMDDEDDFIIADKPSKVKRKFASTRLYISLNF
ncbi:MAG: hypothetical protein J1F67_11370 [Muribaculaceae bacterium]|nr:hypothetical protein [Muribaculaceae bacterium]